MMTVLDEGQGNGIDHDIEINLILQDWRFHHTDW